MIKNKKIRLGTLVLFENDVVLDASGNKIKNKIEHESIRYVAFSFKGARKIYHIKEQDLTKNIEMLKIMNAKSFTKYLARVKNNFARPDIMSFRFKEPKCVYEHLQKEKDYFLIRDDENTFTNAKVNEELLSKYRSENSKLYSMIFYGKVIDREEWYCNVTKDKIRGPHPFKENKRTGTYDLHHIRVENGESVHKKVKNGKKIEPSNYIKSKIDIDKLHEIMQCVLLSRRAHNAIHDFRNTDIRSYKKSYIPYAVKSEKNYNKVIKWVIENTDIKGNFMSYSKLFNTLISDNIPDIVLNKIKIKVEDL